MTSAAKPANGDVTHHPCSFSASSPGPTTARVVAIPNDINQALTLRFYFYTALCPCPPSIYTVNSLLVNHDMSASNEERRIPHADAHGGSDADTWSGRARLSSNDLTQRSSTVIDAQELHRVLECSQLQRQYHYQQLCRQ